MAKLETLLPSHPATSKPSAWWRYIDDIFITWNHCAEIFIEDRNIAHSTIVFTANWSHQHIPFLDTLVSLLSYTQIHTKILLPAVVIITIVKQLTQPSFEDLQNMFTWCGFQKIRRPTIFTSHKPWVQLLLCSSTKWSRQHALNSHRRWY